MNNEVYFEKQDIDANKTVVFVTAVLQCLTFKGIGLYLLFFIPLVACNNSPYAKYYANQGLLILILNVILAVIGVIPLIGWLISAIGGFIVLILSIINAVHAYQGVRKGIPIFGGIEIIK